MTGSIPVPLFSVFPDPNRPELTDVTVQIPYEANPLRGPAVGIPQGTLTLSRNGTPGMSVPVTISPTNVHIARTCDQLIVQAIGFSARSPGSWHDRGTRATSLAPAAPGEILVIYAVGLGAMTLLIPDGTAPVSCLPLQYSVNVYLTYSDNPQINVQLPASAPPGTPTCNCTNAINNVNITLYGTGTLLGATLRWRRAVSPD